MNPRSSTDARTRSNKYYAGIAVCAKSSVSHILTWRIFGAYKTSQSVAVLQNYCTMTDKRPRRIVPVYSAQPKRLEDNIFYFPPIRKAQSSSPHSSQHQHSRFRSRNLSQHNRTNRKDENIPPGTQPQQSLNSSSDKSGRANKKRCFIETSCLKENARVSGIAESEDIDPHNSSDESGRPVKKRPCPNYDSQISAYGRIADSIEKMAAEAREDRQQLNNTLKKILRELSKGCKE